jgi:alanyl-tRNA synthetase
MSGVLRVGDVVTASVEGERRRRVALNHSATHLLHAALRTVLGKHVEQKGSLVGPDRLRFDFSHPSPLSREEVARIEALVNREIQRNSRVDTDLLEFDDAIARGAMALFGEKYGDRVRVLTMGEGFSVELCGGTHVTRTGDIGLMRIVAEGGVAAGVRRIEAVTGPGALAWIEENDAQLDGIVHLLKGSRRDATERVRQLLETNKSLQRELEQLRAQAAAAKGSDLAQRAVNVGGVKVLAERLDGVDGKALLTTLDALKDRLGSAVIVLGQVDAGKVNLIAGVTKDLVHKVKAGELVASVGQKVGARGGGRPDMARAGGGEKPEALSGALASVADWVAERVAANG